MSLARLLWIALPAPLFSLAALAALPRIETPKQRMIAWGGVILSGLACFAAGAWTFSMWWGQLAGVAAFAFLFRRYHEERYAASERKLLECRAAKQKEAEDLAHLKSEWAKSEKDITRTLRLYGTMKGLGEAITWDEMTPHIDYAVQQFLGFKDFQLFLKDENEKPQKLLSRGYRLQEPPLKNLSQEPKLHWQNSETYLEIPVRQGRDRIGVIWGRLSSPLVDLHAAKGASERQELLLEAAALAEALAVGLQKARLFSSIEKLSRIDGLTGVFRRQIFNERIEEEVRRAQAFRTGFSVLLIDLDHFKHINDTYGHQAGDEVLRRAGRIFLDGVYETDFVARYGGEEFVILLPQADPAGVMRKADGLRQKIAQETFQFGWNQIHVTASMGIAHFPQHGSNALAVLQAADSNLYKAKENGRNQVV